MEIFKLDGDDILGTYYLKNCILEKLEDTEGIISSSSIDLYDVTFIQCNKNSKNYSVKCSEFLYFTNVVFHSSGGASVPSAVTPVVNVQSTVVINAQSEYGLSFTSSNVSVYKVNCSKNKCSSPFETNYGSKILITRFVTFSLNDCTHCSNIEADNGCRCYNSKHLYINNNCSSFILSSFLTDCYCDWFYFINNNISLCRHLGTRFIFTNSFTTTKMSIVGTISGIINVDPQITEPLFPVILEKCNQTIRAKRSSIIVTLTVSIFLDKISCNVC